ncbi:MAG TPA: hypothetical protein VEJ67_09560 [Candidatus Cybelea sp.]|nr:hypothetical protein [Candidatus Cybelea sp.]
MPVPSNLLPVEAGIFQSEGRTIPNLDCLIPFVTGIERVEAEQFDFLELVSVPL